MQIRVLAETHDLLPLGCSIYEVDRVRILPKYNLAIHFVSNRIKSIDLEIDASSASVINLGVACNNLDIDASSAAVINIWGETEILTAELSPTAIANLKDLSAKNANIEASTGTIVELPKTENINLNQATGAIIK